MRVLSLFATLLITLPNSMASPQLTSSTSTSSTQAITLLKQSASAMTGTVTISDVTLSGSARRIAGSDDETGTATLKAISGGTSSIDLSLPSGQRTEILNSTTTLPTGSWSGPDGVSHPIAYHNLLIDSAWFFPAFAIALHLSNSSYVATYVGQGTRNGQAVQHITVVQLPPSAEPLGTTPTWQHLTQLDLYLDASTLLPLAITYNVHPDSDAGIDLPVEIRFSDYRVLIGNAQAPFHVQKFLNNTLLLDFQAQSATPNGGLSASSFDSL